MNLEQIEQMNAQHVRIVVRAAWEDLVATRQRHGQNSSAYAQQTSISQQFIHGHLESVLMAALAHLEHPEAGHDVRRRPTGTD